MSADAASPRFSILTPVYDPPPQVLRDTIESVRIQSCADWELCLVDDGSPDAAVRDYLTERERRDVRIHVRLRSENGHISASTNDGIAVATGEYVAFLDHDDWEERRT